MKRRIGTILSVLGLLAVGTAAAAVNVRMLHGTGEGPAGFSMRATSDVLPLTPAADQTPGTAGLSPVGSVPGPGGLDDADLEEAETDDNEGSGVPAAPQLTEAQMTLLRVAAMLRMEPHKVLDVARGMDADAADVAQVRQAAVAVGTSLAQLAKVTDLPKRPVRGHGGFGEHRDGGDPGKDGEELAEVTSNDD